MDDTADRRPVVLGDIEAACVELGFKMSCDPRTGSLLRTLATSKPGARILELGTGTGVSAAWLPSGMSEGSSLLTVENDERLCAVAEQALGADERVRIVHGDASRLGGPHQVTAFGPSRACLGHRSVASP